MELIQKLGSQEGFSIQKTSNAFPGFMDSEFLFLNISTTQLSTNN